MSEREACKNPDCGHDKASHHAELALTAPTRRNHFVRMLPDYFACLVFGCECKRFEKDPPR